LCYLVVAIVPDRDGKDFVPSQVMLDIAQDPFMAAVYRTGLIVALEEFFGRVQIFGDTLAACPKGRKRSLVSVEPAIAHQVGHRLICVLA
jgi:hypothetical protein